MCPHFKVGYCKYKDKCSKGHAKQDCLEIDCKTKTCNKRHRRHRRRYGPKCSFSGKNSCEYKHQSLKVDSDNPNILLEYQKEAEKHIKKSAQLRVDIRSLQETIEKQKTQMTKLENEKTLNKSKKEVELLKAKVECLNSTINFNLQ